MGAEAVERDGVAGEGEGAGLGEVGWADVRSEDALHELDLRVVLAGERCEGPGNTESRGERLPRPPRRVEEFWASTQTNRSSCEAARVDGAQEAVDAVAQAVDTRRVEEVGHRPQNLRRRAVGTRGFDEAWL